MKKPSFASSNHSGVWWLASDLGVGSKSAVTPPVEATAPSARAAGLPAPKLAMAMAAQSVITTTSSRQFMGIVLRESRHTSDLWTVDPPDDTVNT
jgi:hypothetical protein